MLAVLIVRNVICFYFIFIGTELKVSLINQFYHPPDLDELFEGLIEPCNLNDMFKVRKARFNRRTSSAHWTSPMLKPSGKPLLNWGCKNLYYVPWICGECQTTSLGGALCLWGVVHALYSQTCLQQSPLIENKSGETGGRCTEVHFRNWRISLRRWAR